MPGHGVAVTEAPQWSFIVTDGRTASTGGQILIDAAAPYTQVKWSDGVDQGNLTASIALDSIPEANRLDYFDIDRTMIWPCIDGTPIGAWTVTSLPPRRLGDDVVQVVAQPSFRRLMEGRTVRSTLIFNNRDQFDIARDLIRYATGQATLFTSNPQPVPKSSVYGAWWLRAGAGLSGQLRDRLDNTDGWQGSSRKPIMQCFESLMNLVNGFEFVTVAGLDDQRMPYLEVRFGSPRFGSTDTVGTIEWTAGLVTAGAHGVDGSERASLVEALSDGEAPNQLVATSRSADAEARRMPRETAFAAGTISVFATLQEKADQGLRQDGPPVQGFSLTLGSDAPFRPYDFPWGSTFRLVIEDPGFPRDAAGAPAEFTVRVRGASIAVGGYGAADTVDLDVEVLGGI
jgi:hypothetical protein